MLLAVRTVTCLQFARIAQETSSFLIKECASFLL
jgi:hypothetical protein